MTDFEEWYAKYYKDVYKFTLSLCRSEAEAEELTQNAFFKALNSIESFKGECSVYAWLCQIAKNAYFTQCRRKKYFAPQEPPETAGGTEPEQTVLTAEAAMELHRALHGMEEPYKEVLMLRIFGELPFARIAELFGKTENWACVTYHRARGMIRTGLEENENEK